ncbi:MAG TPA: hypothetical protein VHK02_03715 [Actinomycetota bacterium]|nr:hypothetical protein [Actinomycetota bacterium]
MTDLARAIPADRDGRSVGSRRPVAGFPSFPEAENAVDRLASAGFPVDRAAIVGRGVVVLEVGARMGDRMALRALAGGRPEVLSAGDLRAATYEVLADEEVAEEAARLLDHH